MQDRRPANDGTRRTTWRGVSAVVSCASCVLALPAFSLTPAQLLTPDLAVEPVHLIAIGGDKIVYFDQDRVQRTGALSQFVQVRGIAGRSAAPDTKQHLVQTIDGQQFYGRWLGATDEGDALRWRHTTLGELMIPLTQISKMRLTGQTPPATPAGASDTVVLANGDTISGFIEAIGPRRMLLVPDGAEQAIELPTNRIAALSLSNPIREPAKPANLLVLTDGTRVWADQLMWSSEGASFQVMGSLAAETQPRTVSVASDQIVRIDLASSGLRLRDLADTEPQVTAGGDVFGVPFLPHTQQGDVILHAPVTVAFALPEGVTRVGATAELDLPRSLPETRRALAGCVLVIRYGTGQERRIELTPDQPGATLNVPITGDRLEVQLEEGAFGPILDRVRLKDAVMLESRAGD